MYLRPQAKAKYLQRFFAKRKDILPLNVKTFANSKEVAPNATAHFAPYSCQIHVKNRYLRPSTIAHENEHAFQYALSGRYYLTESGNIVGTYTERKGAKLFGKCPEYLMADGKAYAHGIRNYPHLSPTENLRENPMYWFNETEDGARKEAQKWIQYDNVPHSQIINSVNF